MLKTERVTEFALSFKKICVLLGAIELALFTHIAHGAGALEEVSTAL